MELWWSLTLLLSLLSVVLSQNPHKRFEYKYSFKGPYLTQKDNIVPFWSYGGNAIASEESVRITTSLRSQKGQIWTKNATNFKWWEVEIVFRVTGRGRTGADGLAIWFTDKPGVEGPVFGSSDQWVGLGVFFDSFDNDNKRNNPYVMAMINDGTKVYDHEHDGASQQLGGCLRDFRNKPFPVRAKIEYYRNVLTVKTQQLQYDYSNMEEENDNGNGNETRNEEPLQPVEPYESSTTTEVPRTDFDESATTVSPEFTTTHLPEEAQTTEWWDSEDGTTTLAPEVLTTTESGVTQDGTESSHVLEEPVHENTEGEMEGGWGWFGTSEGTPTEMPAETTTPMPAKKKSRRRRKKTRRNRTKKKKRLGDISSFLVHSGMTNNEKDYEICMRSENVHLPLNGYYGITAATGGLADDHDVLKFLVSSLHSPEDMAVLPANMEEENRINTEFEKYQNKVKEVRAQQVAQNPDALRPEDVYETEELRALRQVFQGQEDIHERIRTLHAKMDEIIGRQERTLGLVSAVHSGMSGQVVPTGQVPPAQVGALPGDSIRRHEVDSILNNQRDIVSTAREIKNFVNDIHQKSSQLLTNSQKPQGSVQPVGFDLHVTLNEMKEGLDLLKNDVRTAKQRLTSGPSVGCPVVSCVSTTMFIIVMVVQAVLIGFVLTFREMINAQRKKLF